MPIRWKATFLGCVGCAKPEDEAGSKSFHFLILSTLQLQRLFRARYSYTWTRIQLQCHCLQYNTHENESQRKVVRHGSAINHASCELRKVRTVPARYARFLLQNPPKQPSSIDSSRITFATVLLPRILREREASCEEDVSASWP